MRRILQRLAQGGKWNETPNQRQDINWALYCMKQRGADDVTVVLVVEMNRKETFWEYDRENRLLRRKRKRKITLGVCALNRQEDNYKMKYSVKQ